MRGDFRPLRNKNVQMLDHFFPLLFRKDSKSGITKPEPRFGETFGFALFCQGSVSFARFFARFCPFFAQFCPVSPFFCPVLPRFCLKMPVFGPVSPGFAQFRPFWPGSFGFVQIHQDSFGFVRPLFAWFRPSLFRISKNIGHPTSGSGGKKTVKRYLKSEQTNTHTDGHFDL